MPFLCSGLLKRSLCGLLLWSLLMVHPAMAETHRRIMVLPFRNLSQQEADGWLSDSFSESLIMGMGQVPGLRLIERSEIQHVVKEQAFMQSVLADATQAPRLGQLLGAEYIVVGNFQRVGQRIQINVRLVNAETGEIEASSLTQVQGSFEQLFELQAELAEKLVARLNGQTTPADVQRLQNSIQATHSTRAHEFYIRGLSQLAPLNSDRELKSALDWFHKAIAEDPNYALAYAGLAEVYAGRALSPSAYVSFRDDDAQQAMNYAQKALHLKPDAASSFHALSFASAAQGKTEEALQAAQEAVQRDNDSRYLRHYIQLKYGMQFVGNPSVFESVYAELETLGADLNDPLLLELLSSSYMFVVFQHPERDHSVFLARFEQGFEHNPRLTQLGMYLAMMHKVLGHEDKFNAILDRAESANKDNAMALFILSISLANMRSEFERGLRVVNRIIVVQPDFAPAYQIRSELYLNQFKDRVKAQADIERSVQLAPKDADVLDYAGGFYLDVQELKRAENLFLQALRFNQEGRQNTVLEAQIYFHLGQVRRQQKRYSEALDYYKRAIENPAIRAGDPRLAMYLRARAELASEQGDFDLALADITRVLEQKPDWQLPQWEYKAYYLQQALQKSPDDARLHNDLGQVYLQLGAAEEALPHLLKARLLDEGNAVIAYNLGLNYQELKQWEQARAEFKASLERDSTYLKARFSLAQLDYQQGDLSASERELKQVLQLSPDYLKALELMASIRESQGKKAEALQVWQKILALDPQSFKARKKVEELKP